MIRMITEPRVLYNFWSFKDSVSLLGLLNTPSELVYCEKILCLYLERNGAANKLLCLAITATKNIRWYEVILHLIFFFQIKNELSDVWNSINSTQQCCSDLTSSLDTLSVKVRLYVLPLNCARDHYDPRHVLFHTMFCKKRYYSCKLVNPLLGISSNWQNVLITFLAARMCRNQQFSRVILPLPELPAAENVIFGSRMYWSNVYCIVRPHGWYISIPEFWSRLWNICPRTLHLRNHLPHNCDF